MRVCIIGNSHVAALKHGAAAVTARYPDLKLGFFAARSNRTGGLAVVEGCYRPDTVELADQLALTSGGLRLIDPADWDAYLVYGYGGRSRPGDLATGLSRSFRREIFAERIAATLLPRHLAALRSLTSAPLFAALAPLRAKPEAGRRTRLLRHSEEVALVQERFCDPHQATLIVQPEASLRKDLYTRARYTRDARPLERADQVREAPHHDHDLQHMNADYGALWLAHFLPQVEAALAARNEPQSSDCLPKSTSCAARSDSSSLR